MAFNASAKWLVKPTVKQCCIVFPYLPYENMKWPFWYGRLKYKDSVLWYGIGVWKPFCLMAEATTLVDNRLIKARSSGKLSHSHIVLAWTAVYHTVSERLDPQSLPLSSHFLLSPFFSITFRASNAPTAYKEGPCAIMGGGDYYHQVTFILACLPLLKVFS